MRASSRRTVVLLMLVPILGGALGDCDDTPEQHPVVSTSPEAMAELEATFGSFLTVYRQFGNDKPMDIKPGSAIFRTLEGLQLAAPEVTKLKGAQWDIEKTPPVGWCEKGDEQGRLSMDVVVQISKKKTADTKLVFDLCMSGSAVDPAAWKAKPHGEPPVPVDLERAALVIGDAYFLAVATHEVYLDELQMAATSIEDKVLGCAEGTGAERGDGAWYCVNGDSQRHGAYREAASAGHFVSGKLTLSGQYESGEKSGTWTTFGEDGKASGTEEHDGAKDSK
jgi:hypothetical protein